MIDTHHHFWHYDARRHGWIPDEMNVIRRDWTPADLRPHLEQHGISGVVSIEAGTSEDETRFLLEHANAHDFIVGVVGWVDLTADDAGERLDVFRDDPLFVGTRHVVQAMPDGFLRRDDFNSGMAALAERELAYDLLIFGRQLTETIGFVDRHPTARFVLDHLAKPRVDAGEMEPWATHLAELAKRDHVTCKISGGITEADLAWTPDSLRPYLDAALDAFGPNRLMFGSNWPLSEAAGGYGRWLDFVRAWASPMSEAEREMLFDSTARSAYRLGDRR